MVDIVSKAKRSRMMSGIRGKDTKPEVVLRKSLFNKGLRYRKNYAGVPGKPDIYFPRLRVAVFVHGCFWHGHADCHLAHLPKSNTSFWRCKIAKNLDRDTAVQKILFKEGVRFLIVWECAIKGKQRIDLEVLATTVENWVRNGAGSGEIRGNEFRSACVIKPLK